MQIPSLSGPVGMTAEPRRGTMPWIHPHFTDRKAEAQNDRVWPEMTGKVGRGPLEDLQGVTD